MRSVLVTGGAGFIGSNFVHYWAQAHPKDRLLVVDALTYAGNRSNLGGLIDNGRVSFVQGDICHGDLISQVLLRDEVDTLVHFAAESHVDRSITGPLAFIRTNILGTQVLLDAFFARWEAQGMPSSHRFIHVSTDEVYGSLEENAPPFEETSPYAPNNPYAASKAGSDHLVRAFIKTHNLPAIITHCTNNYGPFQLPEKLIAKACIAAIKGVDIPIYGDGGQVRDWLHVVDHCRALERVLLKGRVGETYNIGAECPRQNLEILRALLLMVAEEAPGLSVKPPEALLRHVVDRPGHDRRYGLNPKKLMDDLGWRPQVDLRAGLRETVRWYLQNPGWWQPLLERSHH